MSPEQRELLRLALLRVMDANQTGRGLGAGSLTFLIGRFGASASIEEINAELVYFADKGFVTAVQKAISPELTAWRITAEGRDWIAQN